MTKRRGRGKLNEGAVLAEIYRRFALRPPDRRRGVRVGVGDDAAWIRIGGADLIVTTDCVVDGVDFDGSRVSWADAAWKAVSASVSDLYASGARPLAFLVSAGIPPAATPRRVRQLLSGIQSAAAVHRASVIGGDLTRSDSLFLDVCSFGTPAGGMFKSRSGARPGDFLFLSAPVGAARAGLLLMQRGLSVPSSLKQAQIRPTAPRDAGLRLARESAVSAMMDVSDGLLIDLNRLCIASSVRADILPGQVPVMPVTRRAFDRLHRRPVEEAMMGGEDYCLLFTVRPPVPRWIRSRYYPIGRIGRRMGRQGAIYNMERRPPGLLPVRGFLHEFA